MEITTIRCNTNLITQCAKLWRSVVCVFVCGSVNTITQNCVHRSSPSWVCR